MGRKIPGRKHRGVRDPEKQATLRYNSIKDKINAPPSNPDDQKIPKSLQRIIELKNKVKNGDFNRKRIKNKNCNKEIVENKKFESKPEKPVPVFKQRPGETDRAFVHRMNKICMDFTKEAKFEEKYGVDIKRNADGEIAEVVKRPKDELEIYLKKVRKEKKEKKIAKKQKKNKTENGEVPILTKSQKWAQKKKQKLMKKKSQQHDEFQSYKDHVKFGETVHAPPTLVAPRKAEKTSDSSRPGQKQLLLKAVLQTDSTRQKKEFRNQNQSKLHKVNNVINKKGKRKDLPHSLRRQLEKQQKEIIGAYKELKAKQYEK